jgi:endogenous inhibitor of DNA gyrase (YacG/DUF329 family)
MSGAEQPRQVLCPTCGCPSAFVPANRWRPFCSERCRGIDLGAWASERFRVVADGPPSDADDPAVAVPDRRGPNDGA